MMTEFLIHLKSELTDLGPLTSGRIHGNGPSHQKISQEVLVVIPEVDGKTGDHIATHHHSHLVHSQGHHVPVQGHRHTVDHTVEVHQEAAHHQLVLKIQDPIQEVQQNEEMLPKDLLNLVLILVEVGDEENQHH